MVNTLESHNNYVYNKASKYMEQKLTKFKTQDKWIPPKLVGIASSDSLLVQFYSFWQMSICILLSIKSLPIHSRMCRHLSECLLPIIPPWKWYIFSQESLSHSFCTFFAAISATLKTQTLFVVSKYSSLLIFAIFLNA